MRKGFIISLTAAVIGFIATSCAKEDSTLRYNNATMGNVVDGTFISDQGNVFNIVEQTCTGDLKSHKRAFVVCDVLNKVEGTENEYDVKLNYIASVLVKEAIPVSSIPNIETYMNDPLVLHDIWFSSGYMNIYISLPVKHTGGKTHEINLIHEQKDGLYKFSIRHNAEGEILKDTGDNSDLIIAYAYASFPISSIIKEDNAKLEISLNQYILSGNQYTPQTQIFSFRRDYTKSESNKIAAY